MSFDALLTHQVTISTPDTIVSEDRYGNPQYHVGASDGTVVSVSKALVQGEGGAGGIGSSTENIIDRDTRMVRYRLFFPPEAPVTSLSTLTWGTKTLYVVGEPTLEYTPRGLHHLVARAEERLG